MRKGPVAGRSREFGGIRDHLGWLEHKALVDQGGAQIRPWRPSVAVGWGYCYYSLPHISMGKTPSLRRKSILGGGLRLPPCRRRVTPLMDRLG